MAHRTGEPVTQSLTSTYYDTAGRRLLQRGVALRVRHNGLGYIQTLKAGTGLTRDEWEWPVATSAPDITVIAEPAAWTLVAGLKPDDLRPMFETRFERTLYPLNYGSPSVIELAVDHGVIVGSDGREQPISELELELKAGTPSDLYRLALELAESLPLRVEAQTKSARGFALAAGQPPQPVKAHLGTLAPDITVDAAMTEIFATCFQHFADNESCAYAGNDPEGVHQARVALRRFRAAIGLFRAFVPTADREWIVGELRWLDETLGPARDWDVFRLDLTASVAAALASHPALAADLNRLDAVALERREAAYRALRATLESPRFTRFRLGFDLWLADRSWRAQPVAETSMLLFRPLVETARLLLEARHRKARKAGAHFADLDSSRRHRVRIALKNLRYAVDFFRTLYPDKTVARFLRRLCALQDTLGHLNDVATAARLALTLAHTDTEQDSPTAAAANRGAGIVLGWHGHTLIDDEPHLISQWSKFRKSKRFWHTDSRVTGQSTI